MKNKFHDKGTKGPIRRFFKRLYDTRIPFCKKSLSYYVWKYIKGGKITTDITKDDKPLIVRYKGRQTPQITQLEVKK